MSICPRCDAPLTATDYEEVELEACDRCGGRWLDPDSLKAIVDAPAPAGGPPTGKEGVPGLEVSTALHEGKPNLLCPDCREGMEPFNFAGDSGIFLGKCHRCGGVWLDAGQLEQVRQAVAASRQDIERDIKRFSGTLHEVEVQEDLLEQKDNRTTPDPTMTTIANRILGD